MRTKDYMVTSDYTDEEMFSTLADARKRAKELSKEVGHAIINRWVMEYEEMTFDEYFQIDYESGKEVAE